MQNRMLLPHHLYQRHFYVNMSFDTEHLHDIRISAQVTCLSNCGFKKFFFLVLWPINIISLLLSRVGKTKTGDPWWEKHLQPNPQAELS